MRRNEVKIGYVIGWGIRGVEVGLEEEGYGVLGGG